MSNRGRGGVVKAPPHSRGEYRRLTSETLGVGGTATWSSVGVVALVCVARGRGFRLPFVHRVGLLGLFLIGGMARDLPARNSYWPVNNLRKFSGGFNNFFEDLGRVTDVDYFLRVGGGERVSKGFVDVIS